LKGLKLKVKEKGGRVKALTRVNLYFEHAQGSWFFFKKKEKNYANYNGVK
jgi:hypothetical protein